MTDPAARLVDYARPAPGVARITLQRPEALNAINLAMRDEFWAFIQAVRLDSDDRAIRDAGGEELREGLELAD